MVGAVEPVRRRGFQTGLSRLSELDNLEYPFYSSYTPSFTHLEYPFYSSYTLKNLQARQLLVIFSWRPIFRDMRKLPGFKDLMRDIGIVDYWRTTGHWGDFCRPVGEDDFECE